MKTMIYTEYGSPDVLHMAEMATPVPRDNEVLIRIHATSVNFGDLMARNFNAVTPRTFNMPFFFWLPARLAFGIGKPRNPVLGSEFAGDVAAVGKTVTRFKLGDAVFGYLGARMGAYAEYVCMPEDGALAIKPAQLTYEQAAVVPYGAIMALSLLRRVELRPGDKVLIIGASGGIGSAAVQIARQMGAQVTGVCATPRVDFVKALGADRVIDYTRVDFTQSGETYDVIFDILGKSSFARCRHSLTPDGRYLLASFKVKQLLRMLWTSKFDRRKVICALAPGSAEDLRAVKELIESGHIRAIIDRCYPLEQVAEAQRYVESGRKRGPVAVTMMGG